MRSSPQRDVSRGSLAWFWVARSASRPCTPWGRWFGLAFSSFYSGNTQAHRDCHSFDLFGARTSVSSMPVGERSKQFIIEHLLFPPPSLHHESHAVMGVWTQLHLTMANFANFYFFFFYMDSKRNLEPSFPEVDTRGSSLYLAHAD